MMHYMSFLLLHAQENYNDVKTRQSNDNLIVQIPFLNINEEVNMPSVPTPYLAHAIMLSQLIYLLFLKNEISVMFIEFSPLLLIAMSIFQKIPKPHYKDIENLFTTDFSSEDSSLDDLEDKITNSNNILLQTVNYNTGDEVKQFIFKNKNQLRNISFKHLDHIAIEKQSQKIALHSNISEHLPRFFDQCFDLYPSTKCESNSKYKSLFPEFKNKDYKIKIGLFTQKVNDVKFKFKDLDIDIELDSLTVLSRIIILITLIQMSASENGLYMFQFNLFTHIFLNYLKFFPKADSAISGKHVKFSVISDSNIDQMTLPLNSFEAIYGYAFKSIEKKSESIKIRDITGKDICIIIDDIYEQQYEKIGIIKPIGSYIFSVLLLKFNKNLQSILSKISITPEISKDQLLNCINCELLRMINISIKDVMTLK